MNTSHGLTRLGIPTALLIAGVFLLLFLAFPWLLSASRALGWPDWIYGAVPMVGWLRVWALVPVWLLLGALIAACLTLRQARL